MTAHGPQSQAGRRRRKAPFLLPVGEGNARITPEVMRRGLDTRAALSMRRREKVELARRLEVDEHSPETEAEAERLDAIIEAAEPELEKLRAKCATSLR